jgi:alcohol dehydrogenase
MASKNTMKALVWYGVQDKRWEEKPIPKIERPTDVVVQMQKTTICGTDLHILKGYVPTVSAGRTIGHEGIGVIVDVGTSVTNFKKGDQVLISCITSCGKCHYCKKGIYGHCSAENGGWVLGNTVDGCQAEYVRIPHADNSLHHIPSGVDLEAFVMLSDILPTGLEVGVLCGNVQPGTTMAIVGAGPVGLSALIAAQFYSPSEVIMIDLDDNRLEVSRKLGATKTINNKNRTAVQEVMAMTDGHGVDIVLECIGTPIGWDISEEIVTAGGRIAICGVHGKSVTLHLERMWKKNFTMTAGLVHTTTIPMLMKLVQSGRLEPRQLISHNFNLSDIDKAYTCFANAADHKALKVIITNDITASQ